MIVADTEGRVLHSAKIAGALWHGPRAVDISGGTLMYAEYTLNGIRTARNATQHKPSRVLRSRDFGRTWQIVREDAGIRHFHFLQVDPHGGWWLASGDGAGESRSGNPATTATRGSTRPDAFGTTVTIGAEIFSRRIFRLTDLAWDGDDIVWGSDDVLRYMAGDARRPPSTQVFGSRMFRGDPSTGAAPRILGRCGPEVRNIVSVGDFRVVMTQSSHHFARDGGPRVFLMPKHAPESGLHHLFDVERHARRATGFTYSRASRSAQNGVFFTYRSPTDVFRSPTRNPAMANRIRMSVLRIAPHLIPNAWAHDAVNNVATTRMNATAHR